uniref:Transposase Tc1-like domain-containing protein n=1 Tax=Naja naja TaxID=35670 RepID=A0A8C7E2M2_NAJNA
MVSQSDSVGITIMGKTADLTVVQKTIIDTLHKEGKPQKVIAKEVGCSQSAISKHINRKLCGREKCGRKGCTSSRDYHSLEWIVRKRPFKSVGDFHKEWTEAGVSASRATIHRWILDMGFKCHQKRLTWAKEKQTWSVAQWSKVLFSDESNFCISFGNQGPRVWGKNGEAHTARCLKSNVKFPQSVLIWGAMSSAGVGPLCFIKSRVNVAIYQEILEHFMLPSTDELYGDADFIFSRTWHLPILPKAPKPGSMTMGLLCLIGQQTHLA